ncbi:MAG: 4-alpha-glucanotransferase [Anaerolineales bacterium]|nr:4-alpha-glucanotransferase [Anaerolineales bacterium]
MKLSRGAGILLHPTSLPSRYGIGDLGPQAFHFVDFLAGAGIKFWQVLPLGPTGYGDSPYQSFSAFAGNPYLISPDALLQDNFLHPDDMVEALDFPEGCVDFGRVIPLKLSLLERAHLRFTSDRRPAHGEFERFCAKNKSWLDDYALFMSIKEIYGGGAWSGWPLALRQRNADALHNARKKLSAAIERYAFYQFIFFRQWDALRTYAVQRGVKIIGDIPIFVSYDSADVWANPDLFLLDEQGDPTAVAGVPPDYFSPTGQLWGNPLYDWNVHKTDHFSWWLNRFHTILAMVDIVRLDHFRGFAAYWEIPAGSPTAETGRWAPGPGADLFDRLRAGLGGLPIIAEDLGEITPNVFALRDRFGLPGMKVLQFAFTGPDNQFLPHYYPENCVVYTGTHDNDTIRGWYASASEHERDFVRRYLSVDGSDIAWDRIRAAWHSRAVLAVTTLQDLLDLDSSARMNYPGRMAGNWGWRMGKGALTDVLQDRLRNLTQGAGR